MDTRTRHILETAVHDFIKTGRPVTSHTLFHDYDFGIKPAMIRRELHELSDDGFFFQTHPSGGRFPSDEAYEFFVQSILEDITKDMSQKISPLRHMQEYYREGNIRDFVGSVGEYLDTFSVGYTPHDGRMYERGLEELLAQLSPSLYSEFLDIVHEIELLEDRIPKRWESWEKTDVWPKVFIGENPIMKNEHLSVIAHHFHNEDNSDLLLMVIGPKRMDYKKSLCFFQSFARALNH